MTRITRIALLCLLVIMQSGCIQGDSPEAALVRNCYESYNKAIVDNNGEAAVALVDENTLKYYGEMRKLALKASREDLRWVSTGNKLMVISIRHRIPLEDLKEMTAESLFVLAVNEGWIGKERVMNNELGDILVFGTRASGVHIYEGHKSNLSWVFRKENGKWKIDISASMPEADRVLKHLVRASGMSENKFLFHIIGSTTGKKVPDSIWDAPIDAQTSYD